MNQLKLCNLAFLPTRHFPQEFNHTDFTYLSEFAQLPLSAMILETLPSAVVHFW